MRALFGAVSARIWICTTQHFGRNELGGWVDGSLVLHWTASPDQPQAQSRWCDVIRLLAQQPYPGSVGAHLGGVENATQGSGGAAPHRVLLISGT